MNTLDLIQGSDEWILARVGSIGASRVQEVIAKTKTGQSASRANLMAELIAERLTGIPAAHFMNDAMRHGTEQEPNARRAYEFYYDVEVKQVGLIKHPSIPGSHASPDGLVGNDGLCEIKCPSTSQHIDTLLGQPIATKYITQMQWQISATGREWCDFVSFDPRLPESMRLFVLRVQRDCKLIAELEAEVKKFLAELDGKVSLLRSKYEPAA